MMRPEATATKGTGGRSDCMILFIMNEADGTAKMLEISRDTMTKIAVYDTKGEYALDSTMHDFTMQYSFGDGANKVAALQKRQYRIFYIIFR